MYKSDANCSMNAFLKDIENFNKEYKKILYSKEYVLGNKINCYVNLLKKFQFIKLFKKVFLQTRKFDKTLNSSEKTIKYDTYLTDKKIIVYTSIFGEYDNILEPIIKPDNIEYAIITDQTIPSESKWKKVDFKIIPDNLKSNTEKNRYCKMFPEKFFKEYEYSIYVDGNVLITSDLSPLTEKLDEFPISMHRHKNRNCVYEEIEACINKKKANKKELIKHRDFLIKNGVPHKNGLLEATIIARKHHDKLCMKIMHEWWNEFLDYSKRDQISLIDVLWKNKISIDTVATMGNNTFLNNLFIIIPHK